MEKSDKTMMNHWNITVGRAARDLNEVAGGLSQDQRELWRELVRIQGDLQYVHDDLADTLNRL